MKLACLCPTFNRPALLANSMACFLAQSHSDRKLFILDDGGQYAGFDQNGICLVSTETRFASLPAKYRALSAMAEDWGADGIVIWDDDDIYMPQHLARIAATLGEEGCDWCHPLCVWSTYTGEPVIESAVGRFWATAAMRMSPWQKMGGVPNTDRADFDQMFLGQARRLFGPPLSPVTGMLDATFVFRWGSTGAPHSQSAIRDGGGDTEWYRRMGEVYVPLVGEVGPKFDQDTLETLGKIAMLAGGTIGLPAVSDAAQ